MKPWVKRPREIRNLFNPAFCGVLLLRCLQGYESVQKKSMPFSLTLFVLPLCLHKESREAVISGNRSYLTKVIEENPRILVGLAHRARSLIPYTFEAFGLLMQFDAITVGVDGRISATSGCIRSRITGTDESQACQRAAQILGKKFATIGDRVTIYTMFGVRP